ncbi:MAG: hypothetical protein HUU43_07665 [Ignavibacteriaceae bacterium]|nr:hypothetical protein [Ignavibacteriaceae bacterium]
MGRELLKFQEKIPSIEAIINSLTEMDKKIETLSNNGIISQSVSSAVSLLETRFLEFKEDTINNLYTISSDQSELYKLFNLGDHINHLSVELQRKDQWINDLEQRISHLENLISGQSEIRNSGYSSEYTPELTKTVPHSNNLTNQYAALNDYTDSSAYRKKESEGHNQSNSPLITRYIASAEGGRISKKNFLNDCIYLKVRNLESILTSRNEQMPLFEEDSDGIFITPRGFSDSLEILPLFDISPNDSNSFQILGLAFNISGSGNNFTLAETALAIKGNGKTYSLKKKGQLIIRD